MAEPISSIEDAETQVWNGFHDEVLQEFPTPAALPEPNIPQPAHIEMEANQNEDVLGCGFMVDKIELNSYTKAVARNLVPFAAFFPVGSQKTFLLKITDLSDGAHLFVPATKEDAIDAISQESANSLSSHKPDHEKGKITIVAFVKQTYNKTDKTLEVGIEAPSKKLEFLDILDPKDFTDYAVMAADGSQERNETPLISPEVVESEPDGNDAIMEEPGVTEDPTKFTMPTLIAVNLSPPSESNLSNLINEAPSASGTVAYNLSDPQQVIVKQETVDEVTEKLHLSGLQTPEPATRKKVVPLQQTPNRSPLSKSPQPLGMRRSFRKTKKELPDEDDSIDNQEILKDITFAPIKPPQKSQKKRGRPRKLIFDDCDEPELKLPRVDKRLSA